MQFISENNFAALVGTSNATVQKWAENGVYPSHWENGIKGFYLEEIEAIPEVKEMLHSRWDEEQNIHPLRKYTSVELFAGGGGLALGLSLAGFNHILLNEFDNYACNTLRMNRPKWNVIEGDVCNIDFTPLRDKVDFLSGGFPCQAFSYAGKQGGFSDTRGTLFFELARAVKEIRPKVFMGENVKGLTSHDNGRTFNTIKNTIAELGYTLVEPRVLKAIMYQVPQKRERLILIAIRNDLAEKVSFHWPSPYTRVLTLKDALYKSVIYDTDVPKSEGVKYPAKKEKVLDLVPQGGDWRNLPEDVAKEYMGGSWLLGGGKTGMARRLSLDEPSLTLTCSPCQKQTERCHPLETRPLTVREYARIQTFPDNWLFAGTMNNQYKQIGNAVPVNLAWAVGRSLIRLFNDIQAVEPTETHDCSEAVAQIIGYLKRNDAKKAFDAKIKRFKENNAKIKQLNFFDLLAEYPDGIVSSTVKEPQLEGYGKSCEIDMGKNVLICLVKKDNISKYLDKNATVYYTGKRFPSTVEPGKLYYFVPYLSGQGARDLYRIKAARVGTRKEGQTGNNPNDYRLVFEIEYIKPLFAEYKQPPLEIWHTYTDMILGEFTSAFEVAED
ncbi:DNA cytosine methyltransferase [Bacteroides stercorirosoris]|uniref:Cytosine-specific methyltransferase n=1 Tax=Bacteroides stercorirosoris TaxID=871324 RepID=A0A413H1S3_9BACE|nr:DNA (cytosine-5-)-methyltransferase [Bacteroides stercorirosoris]RGX77390.1 DNA (cytosine-5-)-methyltransferase [Bacteroides stercorirosoris]